MFPFGVSVPVRILEDHPPLGNRYYPLEIVGSMLVFKNFLTDSEIETGRSCFIEKNTVDYFGMDDFVRKSLLKLSPTTKSLKYRASNNTNRSDASHFHRDLINYGETVPEVYTVLFYLDKAGMEIIPDSHLKPKMSLFEGITSKTELINMEAGDVLVFNACTLHRGKFLTSMDENRRLIQAFDTTFGKEYTQDILHLPCIGQCKSYNFSTISTLLSRIPFINNMNKVTFINTCTGYGGVSPVEQDLISQESGTRRYLENGERCQKDNLYRITSDKIIDVSDKDWYRVHHNIHEKTIFRIIIIIFIILYFLRNYFL